MQTIHEMKLTGTTDASGDLTVTGQAAFGWLYAVEWIDGDLADGVDAVLSCTLTSSTVNNTLLTLTNANDDAWYYPRETVDDNAGAEGSGVCNPVLNGVLQLVISSGGNAKTGGAVVYYFK